MNDTRFIELSARDRARGLLDAGTFRELLGPFDYVMSPWLEPQGIIPQADDGMVVAKGTLSGKPAVVIAIEGTFQGGSMGEVSGAIPHELESCWDWAVKRTELMPDAKLRIETIPAVTHCGSCGQDYATVPQGRTCPHCGSGDTWLIRGDEINIKEIEAI